MNKTDFISWMLETYENDDEQIYITVKKYNNGLLNNINFDKLKDYLVSNYHFSKMPSSQELVKISQEQGYNSSSYSQCEAVRKIEEFKKEPRVEMKDFDEDVKNKIRQFCNKFGKKPSFDL